MAKVGGLKPVLKVTKKPTRKKAGKATVTVAGPAGLVKAGGKADGRADQGQGRQAGRRHGEGGQGAAVKPAQAAQGHLEGARRLRR